MPANAATYVLESRSSGSALSATFNTHFQAIREMEASGGTLGLTSTIDEEGNWTDNTPNIDVHMSKTTEWGAAAILAISSYGAGADVFYGSSAAASLSSTNNATGIYGLAGSWEYNAGGCTTSNATALNNMGYLANAHDKYKVIYSSQANQKANPDGSALDMPKWLGASFAFWVYGNSPVFLRGNTGLFSFSYYNGNGSGTARAVVVCGSGL